MVGCIATFLAFRAPLLVYICLSCDWVKGNLRKKKYGVTNKLAQGTDLNTSANPISTPKGSWCLRSRISGGDNEHKLKEQRRVVEELNNRASVRRHLEVQGKHLRPDIWLWQIFGAMVHQGRSFIFSWWRHDIETFPYYWPFATIYHQFICIDIIGGTSVSLRHRSRFLLYCYKTVCIRDFIFTNLLE